MKILNKGVIGLFFFSMSTVTRVVILSNCFLCASFFI